MPYKDKEFKKQYDAARFQRNRKYLQELKVERGCLDCGYNEHHAGLEFDHREDKMGNVSTFCNGTRERLEKEIAKCDVVCGTCHNLRTWKRRFDSDATTMVV